ncbi:hypothetical protein FB451DRAFT_1390972 [Mycena latifolia]|nr:hypothetical protein FB451DRAFT_1390972 [Mycena latifolia]
MRTKSAQQDATHGHAYLRMPRAQGGLRLCYVHIKSAPPSRWPLKAREEILESTLSGHARELCCESVGYARSEEALRCAHASVMCFISGVRSAGCGRAANVPLAFGASPPQAGIVPGMPNAVEAPTCGEPKHAEAIASLLPALV